MATEISVESMCPGCDYPIKVVAKEYKIHNRDGSPHTCGWLDPTELTFKDCSEYIRVSSGDESQSRCKIIDGLCMADEAGLVCGIWEDEKVELLKEVDETGL